MLVCTYDGNECFSLHEKCQFVRKEHPAFLRALHSTYTLKKYLIKFDVILQLVECI